MPELPEIETILSGLRPHIEGAIIKDVVVRHHQLRWPIPPTLKTVLVQQQVITLSRRAKYLLMRVNTGTLIIHLGMSGSLCLIRNMTPYQRHDHVDIIFSDGKILRFTDPRRFGAVLWTEDDPSNHVLLKLLGLEPLESSFTYHYLKQQAMNRRVAIKPFIMDGQVVAGIGNIYAAEALFLARIHPATSAGSLTDTEYQRLVESIKQVLQLAIKQGGTTVKDFVNSEGKPGYFAQELKVYGRAGLPCLQCHADLQLLILGQRNTVFCEHCQPR